MEKSYKIPEISSFIRAFAAKRGELVGHSPNVIYVRIKSASSKYFRIIGYLKLC
mgnify:FL=1